MIDELRGVTRTFKNKYANAISHEPCLLPLIFFAVAQNAAGRLARLVDAIKAAIFRKAAGVSSISNLSGGSAAATTANRGSRDAATDLQNNDDGGLDLDPLDEAASVTSSAAATSPKNPNATHSGASATSTGGDSNK